MFLKILICRIYFLEKVPAKYTWHKIMYCTTALIQVLSTHTHFTQVNLHFSIISLLDAMDPEYKMALRPLIAIDDQYIVRITVAMQLVQYLLTVESHRGEVPQGSDSTGVVDLWQTLHNWALGCVM